MCLNVPTADKALAVALAVACTGACDHHSPYVRNRLYAADGGEVGAMIDCVSQMHARPMAYSVVMHADHAPPV